MAISERFAAVVHKGGTPSRESIEVWDLDRNPHSSATHAACEPNRGMHSPKILDSTLAVSCQCEKLHLYDLENGGIVLEQSLSLPGRCAKPPTCVCKLII